MKKIRVKFIALIILLSPITQRCTTEKPRLKQVAPGLVRVYHYIGRDGTVDSVKQHGLMTYNELFKKGLTANDPSKYSGVLPDQYDVVYFAAMSTPPTDANSVGFDVDPERTYVYNREHRYDANRGRYQDSKILLSRYIMQQKKAEEMRKNAPAYHAVIFDPRTAEPFYVATTDKRYYDTDQFRYISSHSPLKSRHYLFLNEVIIRQSCIPARELVFSEEDALKSDEMDVVDEGNGQFKFLKKTS
ncbi:MAG TPA: hypothetical protein VGT41_01550 [Candidatus Babeliales bacterium]|nr:hypothetical protein [Candidatus Babeliales bacterium]